MITLLFRVYGWLVQAAGGHVSRAGRVNDNLNLSRAIGDMVYKRNRLRQSKDQIISAEPDVCRCDRGSEEILYRELIRRALDEKIVRIRH